MSMSAELPKRGWSINWPKIKLAITTIFAFLPLPMLALAASHGVYRFAVLFVPPWVAMVQAAAFELTYIGLALQGDLTEAARKRARNISIGAVVVSILYNGVSGYFDRNVEQLANIGIAGEVVLTILHGTPLAVVAYLVSDLILHGESKAGTIIAALQDELASLKEQLAAAAKQIADQATAHAAALATTQGSLATAQAAAAESSQAHASAAQIVAQVRQQLEESIRREAQLQRDLSQAKELARQTFPRLLDAARQLRADGATWEQVSQMLDVAPSTVRTWLKGDDTNA